MLNSLSKSFTSTAILSAIQEGILSPDDVAVSCFFRKCCNSQIIVEDAPWLTLRHLHRCVHRSRAAGRFYFAEHDCVSAFLESEIQGSLAGRFSYNTGATFMPSAALQAKTGQNLVDFPCARDFLAAWHERGYLSRI